MAVLLSFVKFDLKNKNLSAMIHYNYQIPIFCSSEYKVFNFVVAYQLCQNGDATVSAFRFHSSQGVIDRHSNELEETLQNDNLNTNRDSEGY